MELFNKGSRKIDSLQPGKSATVSDEHGKRLLKMYADELVQVGETAPVVISSDSEINEYVKELESEIEELKAGDKGKLKKQVKALESELAEAEEKIEALESELAEAEEKIEALESELAETAEESESEDGQPAEEIN